MLYLTLRPLQGLVCNLRKQISTQKKLWGLDQRDTKIEGLILKSAQELEVLFRARVPTGADKGYDHVLGQIKQLVGHKEESVGSKAGRALGTVVNIIDPDVIVIGGGVGQVAPYVFDYVFETLVVKPREGWRAIPRRVSAGAG